jgi:hypothetical protein
MTHAHATQGSPDEGIAHGRRLDDIGWAVFLIMTGVIWLIPETSLPRGTWLIGTGLLLLGLNAVRALTRVSVSGFTILLGALALVAGLTALWGIQLPLAAICLILVGVVLLTRQMVRRA